MLKTDSPPSGPVREDRTRSIEQRVDAALAFLAAAQRPDGEIPIFATPDPMMGEGLQADPSVFPTALAAHCLSFAGSRATYVRARALAFLLAQMDRNGLWRHWTRAHPLHRQLPPDLDDTSCATVALLDAGHALPANRHLMLANRTRRGLFLTWMIPRLRWMGAAHFFATFPQLRHPATLALFFRRTSARPGDVDAVVNANTLYCLGEDGGLAAVADWLVDLLRSEKESQCDKWYDNPVIVRYFLSRALSGMRPEAGEMIVARSLAAEPGTSLEAALLMSTLMDWHAAVPARLVGILAAGQLAHGGWPAAALYHGGRSRVRGSFAEPGPATPRWGSEALTTAFAVEALARFMAGSPDSATCAGVAGR